jgi:hypothetical protein
VFTSTVAVDNGNGQYGSGSFNPTVPGTYRFVASYSGDTNNSPAGPTGCTDPAESVTVTNASPTVSTSSGHASYTEGSAAVQPDPAVSVTDPDSPQLQGATISISGNFTAADGDTLNFSSQNGITGNYNSGTGVLTLSGNASVANYQTALRSVTFSNTSTNPSTASRTVSFQATDDQAATSNVATRDVAVAATDNAPTVTASGGDTPYTAGTPSTAVDGAVTVSDPDSANMASARVRISAGFGAGDSLNFTNQNGITGSYDAATGALTLSGSATKAAYQTALRSVAYSSSSDNPATSKTVEFKVNDGTLDSNAAIKNLAITRAANPPPNAEADPTVTVTKQLAPNTDPGRFDLNVNGTTVKAAAGDGGSGSAQVQSGTVTVSEAPANGHALADYSTTIDCGPAGSGTGTSLTITHVTANTSCTITNTRRPQPTGHLVIISHRQTTVTRRAVLIGLTCRGAPGTRCRGSLRLVATGFSTRLRHAGANPSMNFDLAVGTSRAVRVPIPSQCQAQLATRRKAVARARALLTDGTLVTRLVTLVSP